MHENQLSLAHASAAEEVEAVDRIRAEITELLRRRNNIQKLLEAEQAIPPRVDEPLENQDRWRERIFEQQEEIKELNQKIEGLQEQLKPHRYPSETGFETAVKDLPPGLADAIREEAKRRGGGTAG